MSRGPEVVAKVRHAYGKLLDADRDLLALDANERSITHKLAEHLQVEFPEWNVDCEYNRDGHETKRIKVVEHVSSATTDAVTVFPDIIVHKRNTANNLVVIEAKKSSTSREVHDLNKLQAYVAELKYEFALMIVFPVGELAANADPEVDIQQVSA